MEAQPVYLRNVADRRERIGIDLLNQTLERGNLSSADDAHEHRVGNLGIHPRRRQGRYASAKLFHDGNRHLFLLVRNDFEFNGGLEAVGQRFVYLALYVRFKNREHNRQQVDGNVNFRSVEYEEGRRDYHRVDGEQYPCNTACRKLLLNKYRQDVAAARTAARLQGEHDCRTKAQRGCNRSEQSVSVPRKYNLETDLFKDGKPNGLECDVDRGQNCKPLFYVKEGEDDEGRVQQYRTDTLLQAEPCVQQDDRTCNTADGEVVRLNQGVGCKGNQYRREEHHDNRFQPLHKFFAFASRLRIDVLFGDFRGKGVVAFRRGNKRGFLIFHK